MKVERFVTGRCKNNCYIIADGDEIAVVDPGEDGKFVAREIQARSQNPKLSILLTHGHADQILCVPWLVEKYPNASVYTGRAENLFLYDSGVNLSRHMGQLVSFTNIASNVKSVLTGDVFKVGKYEFRVVETPGHTPGSIMYVCDTEQIAFCGDTILRENIGGTSLPFGDEAKLYASMRDRILHLPDAVKLFPSHGESTDVAHEKSHNPYILAMNLEEC